LKAIAWHWQTDCAKGPLKNAGIEDAIAGTDPNRCIWRPFGSNGRQILGGADRLLILHPMAWQGNRQGASRIALYRIFRRTGLVIAYLPAISTVFLMR
jgi:hypothetical protein